MKRDSRETLIGGLHLAVLWSFGVAKPLFDVLDDDPGFFVQRSSTSRDIVLLAIALIAVVPVAMLVIEWLVGCISKAGGRRLHLFFVGLLASILALLIIKSLIDVPAGFMFALALAAGAGFAVAYERAEPLRSTLTVLSPAPLLFAFLFLFVSPVSDLVRPPEVKSASAKRVDSKGPLVVVFFDEFPVATIERADGTVNAQRYPSFGELAGTSTWYRDATTAGFSTTQAVPTLLSGDEHEFGTAPTLANYPDSLFTELQGNYKFHAIETVTDLCPEKLCPRDRETFVPRNWGMLQDIGVVEGRKLLPNSIADTFPDVSESLEGFLKQAQILNDIDRYQDWVSTIESGNRTLNFFHLRTPHAPWRFLPHGHSFSPSLRDSDFHNQDDTWVDDPPVVDHFWQRHLLQTGYTDWLLGNLITKLKRQGVWKDATVVVTADHGGAFYPGKHRRTPTSDNLAAIAPVPLFIKGSGQTKGHVVNRHICTSALLSLIDKQIGAHPGHEAPDCPTDKITVGGRDGSASAPIPTVHAQFRHLLAHQTRLFGSGAWNEVYAYGPHGDLVGTRVSAHQSAPPAKVQVHLVGVGAHRQTTLKHPGVHSLVHGTLSGDARGDEPVVAAVNGTIEGIGTTYELNGEFGVAAMIPPRSLLGGGDITLYRILGGGRLQPLPYAK